LPEPRERRHFEDLAIGEVIDLGPITVSKAMVVDFAREFDPFPFHLDEVAAKNSLLGGLAASGWQTAALSMRMLVDQFLSGIASMGIAGFSDLKWKKPVMVGDTIGGTAALVELAPSPAHRTYGIVSIDLEIRNDRGLPVMSMRLANRVAMRNRGSAPAQNAEPPLATNGNRS